MPNQRVVVTGACGFIGSHVAERFAADGYDVVVIDDLSTGRRENLTTKPFASAFESLQARNPSWPSLIQERDIVCHLAALADIVPSIENPESYFRANVEGTLQLLKVCAEKKVRKFVYAASSSCYGLATEIPTTEAAEISPQYPYALTKRMGEELVLHWGQVYKLPVVSLRLFNVYGTRSRTTGTYGAMFGVFLKQKLAGLPYTVVGDGEQTRDFIYVSDVAEAFYLAARSKVQNEVFNIGAGRPVSVNDVVRLLKGEKIHIPKRPGEPDVTHANISKATELLSWAPKVSIEEGVKRMMDQIDYWQEAPLWDAKSIEKSTESWFRYLGGRS